MVLLSLRLVERVRTEAEDGSVDATFHYCSGMPSTSSPSLQFAKEKSYRQREKRNASSVKNRLYGLPGSVLDLES